MHISYTAHNTKASVSCSSLIEYLDKENQIDNNINEIKNNEQFFNSEYDPINSDLKIDTKDIINDLDNNRGSQKISSSNYFMLNISPSFDEMKHMENLAVLELEKRRLFENKNDPSKNIFFNEQKNELMKMQLKLYTKDVMIEYAKNFNREIFVDESKLPNNAENKIINIEVDKLYNDYLKKNNVNLVTNDISIEKEILINENKIKLKENGFFFNVHSDELNKDVQIYLSNTESNIIDNRVFVNEEIYNERLKIKVDNIRENEKLVLIDNGKNIFIDKEKVFEKNEFIFIESKIQNIDEPIKIYFDKKNVEVKNNTYNIKESIYDKEVKNAKINAYKILYADDLKKIEDKNYLETEQKLKGKLTDKDLSNIKTQSSVDFKKLLIEKKLIPPDKSKVRIDFKNRIEIKDFEILQESKQAKLVELNDSSFKEPLKTWIPNYMLDNDENKNLNSLYVPADFIKNKFEEIENLKNEKSIILNNPTETYFYKENTKFNKDCLVQEVNIDGLSKPVSLIFDKDNLVKEGDEYKLNYQTYVKVKEHEIIKQSKIEFANDYLKIRNETVNDNKNIEKKFTEFLKDKGVLESGNDIVIFEKNNYNIGKTTKNITELNLVLDSKSIKIFVPKTDISIKDEKLIIDTKEINNKISKAINLYDKNNELVKISYDSNEIKEVKNNKNNDSYKSIEFSSKIDGVDENLKLKFNVDEVKNINGDFYIEKYKLDYKTKNETNKLINNKYGAEREKIYQDIAKTKGFDLTKRPLEEKDLLWYAKIETSRSYKFTDKSVIHNKEILKQIKDIKESNIFFKYSKIEKLELKLIKDKFTNEIIKEGNLKGGNQYHSHVVVSRHDKTMQNPRNKISLSPLANAIDSKMQNGAQVGFNRTEFAEKIEKVFDKKFEFNRDQTKSFQAYNQKSKVINGIKNETKQFLKKHTGVNEIKKNISPIESIKNEMGIANIPTKLPTSVTQVAVIVVKKIISQSQEIGY